MITFEVPEGWQASKDKYDIPNDQGMKNIQNFVASSGKVLSLFVLDGSAEEGLRAIDNMIRDYSSITKNLSLMLSAKLKIKGTSCPIYIVGERRTKCIMAHLVFEKKKKAFTLIFPIETFAPSMREIMDKNGIINDAISFIKEQK